MKYNFCTLFDSNYLDKGITLYSSLKHTQTNFHLFVYAFDNTTFVELTNRNLDSMTVILFSNIENNDILSVKKLRTNAEYCWTATPYIILHCLEKFNLENCTYLDSDLFFFNSPNILFDEINNFSIALTSHNYTKKYDQTTTSGIFCVQFVYFKNDINGIEALKWWKNKCIDWCYARLEDGKFGDQKYLDDFPIKFKNVHIIQNFGAGLAPWNIQQFDFIDNNHFTFKNDNKNINKVVFYHFHNLKFHIALNKIIVEASRFNLTDEIYNYFYKPYLFELIKTNGFNNFCLDEKNLFIFKKNTIIKSLNIFLVLQFKKVPFFRKAYNFFINIFS